MAEVDPVVLQLLVDDSNYESKLVNATRVVNRESGKQAVAVEQGSARAAGAQRNVYRQYQDIAQGVAIGQSPFTIIGQQAFQLADALQDTGSKAAKVAAFFSGPWGLALLAAGTIAGSLLSSILKESDALDDQVDKLKDNAEKTRIAEQAGRIFASTQEGLEERIKETTKALDAQNESLRTSSELQNVRANQRFQESQKALDDAESRLKAADQRLANLSTPQSSDARLAGARDEAQQAAESAKTEAAQARKDVETARIDYNRSRVFLAAEQAAAESTETGRITAEYDARINAIQREAVVAANAGKQIDGTLKKRLAALEKEKQAAIEAAQAREKLDKKTTNEIGRNITLSDAAAIVRGIGGTVTSAQRSTAKQAELYARYQAGQGPLAAKPGSSYHEAGQALDIAKTAGVTLSKIEAAFKAKGVKILELLDEGDHYHVAFGQSSGAAKAGRDAAKRARDAERAAAEAKRNQEAFDRDEFGLQQDILQATRTRAASAEEQARIDREATTNATQQYIDETNASDRYTQAQKERLIALAKERDAITKRNIQLDLERAQAQQQLQASHAVLTNQGDLLDAQLGLTDITSERKALEERLLKLKYDELRLQQQAIVDAWTRGETTPQEANIALKRINTLNGLESADREGLNRKYEGAGAAYLRSLITDAANVDESFERIEVNGLASLSDGIADAIANGRSLGDVFHNVANQIIADLLRIAIQQEIIKPIASSLFGGGGGSGSGLGSILGAVANIGASFAGGGSTTNVGAIDTNIPFHFANGGAFTIGGHAGVDQNIMSINGQKVARVGRGEIVRVDPTGTAARGGGVTIVHAPQTIMKSPVVTADLLAEVDRRNAQNLRAAAPHIENNAAKKAIAAQGEIKRYGSTGRVR